MTLLWQKIQIRLLGDQLTSPARASILGLYFCSSSAALRLSLAGLSSKTSSSSWLPSLPCLVAGTGVGVWTTGLDPLWGQDPSPGAAPGSLPTPTCQLTVLMSCLFSIAKLQICFPSSHIPLPLVQLCTDIQPSRRPLQKTLHRFMPQGTTWILSDHASYLSSPFSSPSLASFGKWKPGSPHFRKAKQPWVVAERPALTKYAQTQIHQQTHFCT